MAPGGAGAGVDASATVSGPSNSPRLPPGAVDVLEIPPESEMAEYLRVMRGNAPLRAAELRLCWAMAMAADTAASNSAAGMRRAVLPDDLHLAVAEHIQAARVALMLHRRVRALTHGAWER